MEKVSQPKDKDGRGKTFAFITYVSYLKPNVCELANLNAEIYLKVHAVSVPYAISLFQGTQLFNRELTIKPRNNNSNVPQRVDIPTSPLPVPIMRNPFDIHSNNSNDVSNRFDRNREQKQGYGTQYEQSSLRSGFIQTKASMQMQPQPPKRSSDQHPTSTVNVNDLEKLISLGSNMLQPSSRSTDLPKRATYDMLFTGDCDRYSNKLKVTSRQNSRSHYRDQPYSRRDPPRHQHRSSGDRRRH